jgi:hypothetical protein
MPVTHVDGEPGWLQVIHGRNVSNRVRGHLVSPDPYVADFPALPPSLTEPGRLALSIDRGVLGPARRVRDTARGELRELAVRAVGKERFNDAKSLLAQARKRTA